MTIAASPSSTTTSSTGWNGDEVSSGLPPAANARPKRLKRRCQPVGQNRRNGRNDPIASVLSILSPDGDARIDPDPGFVRIIFSVIRRLRYHETEATEASGSRVSELTKSTVRSRFRPFCRFCRPFYPIGTGAASSGNTSAICLGHAELGPTAAPLRWTGTRSVTATMMAPASHSTCAPSWLTK